MEVAQMNERDFVRAIYNGPAGNRLVRGVTEFPYQIQGVNMSSFGGRFRIVYGHISKGDIVGAVHVKDIEAQPHLWTVSKLNVSRSQPRQQPHKTVRVNRQPVVVPEELSGKVVEPEPPPKKESVINQHKGEPNVLINLLAVPRMTDDIFTELVRRGLNKKGALLNATTEELTDIKGVGEVMVNALKEAAQKA